MKNLFALALVAVSTAACAGPDDLLLSQRNSTDTGNTQRIPPHPTTNWGALSYDNVNLSLSWLTFGSGLTINSGILDVAAPTSGQVISALGYTPVDQAGARSAISLTTTGSGAATYNSGTGALNIPTPAVSTFNYGLPNSKTVAVSIDYQAADPTKAAIITPSYACTNATTVLASSACTLQVRVGSSALTCSTGTILYTVSQTVNLGVLLTQAQTVPAPINLPIGAHFIVCPSAGTFTITAVEQTAS